jgi:hypothetical protein
VNALACYLYTFATLIFDDFDDKTTLFSDDIDVKISLYFDDFVNKITLTKQYTSVQLNQK